MNAEILRQYRSLDWNHMLMSHLGDGSLIEAKPFLERAKFFLNKLTDDRVLTILPPVVIANLEAQLQSFTSFIHNEIFAYTDVSQKSVKILNIKNQTANLFNELFKYSVYFDVLPPELDVNEAITKALNEIREAKNKEIKDLNDLKNNFYASIPQYKEALELSTILAKDKSKIEDALSKVDQFIGANEKAVEAILKKNATSFATKAGEHSTFKTTWVPIWLFQKIGLAREIKQPAWYPGITYWLWLGMLFGLIVIGIVGYYNYNPIEDISWLASLQRLSIIIVPSYFAIFSINQYVTQRKLYEIYKFKDIALQTMIILRTQFQEDFDAKNELLSRSLQVIFTEPALKEDVKYDKQFITEIVRMLSEK